MPKSNRNCAVGGCSHTQRTCPKGRFVGFPNGEKQPERRALWIGLVQRGSQWIPTKNSRVCGCHFSGGYKVDDPNDPAYNPSIFPATPELDRRVRKTMMEELYIQKMKARHLGAHGITASDSLLHPSAKEENSDDIMKFVSAALDLSKEAGEEYASAIRSERDESKLRAALLGSGPMTSTGGAMEIGSQHLTSGQLENPFHPPMGTSSVGLSPSSQLIMGGQVAADGQSVSVGQITARDRRTNEGQQVSNSTQNHGWLYINQTRPPGSAMNLTRDSGEVVSRKRKSLHASKPQTAIRFQRFAATNRKLSGNLSTTKPARHMQARYMTRTASSSGVDRNRASDLSSTHSSEQGLSGGSPSQNHVEMRSKDADCRSEASVQTVLSLASPCDYDSAVRWDNVPIQTRGRCHGFHGWSDICFSDATVRRVTGVGQDTFDLLLSCLPETMPGLPAHNSLLLLLMKLKMAVPFEFLASVFSLTAATACNIFTHTLSVLCTPLLDLIKWSCDPRPSSDTPRNCTPECSIVLDFLTIQTERPLTEHQSEMITAEINADTVKVLVGLKANGTICFLSSAYLGNATNADILVNSDLLDHLEKEGKVLLLQRDEKLQQILKTKGFRVLHVASPLSPRQYVGSDSIFHIRSKNAQLLSTDQSLTELSENPKLVKAEFVDGLPVSVDGPPESVHNPSESVDGLPECFDGRLAIESPLSTHSTACRHTPSTNSPHSKMTYQLRSFNIFNSCFENGLLPYIDEVVSVCAALNNLTEPAT